MILTRTVSLKMVQSYEKSELHKKIIFPYNSMRRIKALKNKLGGPRQAFYALTQVNLDSLSKA